MCFSGVSYCHGNSCNVLSIIGRVLIVVAIVMDDLSRFRDSEAGISGPPSEVDGLLASTSTSTQEQQSNVVSTETHGEAASVASTSMGDETSTRPTTEETVGHRAYSRHREPISCEV